MKFSNVRQFNTAMQVLAVSASMLLLSLVAWAEPIQQGQKYVMATHSFNVFIGPGRAAQPSAEPPPGPLALLAAERGKSGHQALAVQMIGGSTPMQHWNQGDGDDTKNIAKVALRQGGVDVFTMSPNAIMPEPAIDLFGDLVIETNPDARIMVQNSWSAWDGHGSTVAVDGSSRPQRPTFTNEDHDNADVATINGWLASSEAPGGYLERLRTQLQGINERAGRSLTSVVPSATAVYELRKAVIEGRVPGITKQSELFIDGLGHVTEPGINVVTYVWFAAMYRESPVGLTALVKPQDPTSAERELLLQQIAWEAVLAEPMSGVTAN